eukprot:185811-Ditylum_brightwellii.AAC.1
MHQPLIQNKNEGDDGSIQCAPNERDDGLMWRTHRVYQPLIQRDKVDDRLMQCTHRAYWPLIQNKNKGDGRLMWRAHRAYQPLIQCDEVDDSPLSAPPICPTYLPPQT